MKTMSRLGSEKNPAIIRVQNMKRLEEIKTICNKHGWHFIIGIEPDKPENISDVIKLIASQQTDMNTTVQKQKTGRNEPCPCGSGRKYKKCCIDKEITTPSMVVLKTQDAQNIKYDQSMESLYNRLPVLAEKETRMVIVMPGHKLPSGEYAMIEYYCNDKKCDCRRVLINIEHKGKVLATINYGWEDIEFYEKWIGDKKLAKYIKDPILEPTGAQSNLSDDLLEFFKDTMLMDKTFVNRLRLHYKAFKASLA